MSWSYQAHVKDLLGRLPVNARRGSKPRCHWITHGPRHEVAHRLTRLIEPWGVVSPDDKWMPDGFEEIEEAELHRVGGLLESPLCNELLKWWLAVRRAPRTPCFDIAATCGIEGRKGLLLVEAKAHHDELLNEAAGKRRDPLASAGSLENHERIGSCIREASDSLSATSGRSWRLSRDSHYQLSNRFAWAWKLTCLRRPVILVYLGFHYALDMKNAGHGRENSLILDHANWEWLVRSHAAGLVPESAWNRSCAVNGQFLVPLIRSALVEHDRPIHRFEVVSAG